MTKVMSPPSSDRPDAPAGDSWGLDAATCAGIYIVIAAYNEGAKIGDVVAELRTRFDHVVVVDDGSWDETADSAFAAGATVLRHEGQLSLGRTSLNMGPHRCVGDTGTRLLAIRQADS